MAEQQAQAKVSNAMQSFAEDLDKSFFRELTRKMHLCAAQCCEDMSASSQSVAVCQRNCAVKTEAAHQYTSQEMEDFQNRMQRCVMVCEDQIRGRVTADLSEKQEPAPMSASYFGKMLRDSAFGEDGIDVYRKEHEVCSLNCIDTHLAQLPALKNKIIDTLKTKL